MASIFDVIKNHYYNQYTLHRPHPEKEAAAYCVVKVREFLIENDITP